MKIVQGLVAAFITPFKAGNQHKLNSLSVLNEQVFCTYIRGLSQQVSLWENIFALNFLCCLENILLLIFYAVSGWGGRIEHKDSIRYCKESN
jgi:hypothetical protein